MDIAGLNIDVGSVMSGAGQLFKDLRTAITGKEPIDGNKAAELAMKMQQMEADIERARISIVLAEASSADPWTSRARPAFMYVIYILILAAIPMGVIFAVNPQISTNIIAGFGAWLKAIPSDLYALFGAGYLGYGAFRTVDKVKGNTK
jgi:hypothetical protein